MTGKRLFAVVVVAWDYDENKMTYLVEYHCACARSRDPGAGSLLVFFLPAVSLRAEFGISVCQIAQFVV